MKSLHSTQSPLIVICGPTATGKTSLAVDCALQFNGEILSADSRQVYRGLDLGTGKDLDEYDHQKHPVPYHLIDIADPGETYSLYHYVEDFYTAFRSVTKRQAVPIACGGTGLYLEAVLKNYRISDAPEDTLLRAELMHEKKEKLEAALKSEAPDLFAETDRSSIKRIIRSLEISRYRQTHPVHFTSGAPPAFSPLILAVRFPRDELIERINFRLDARLKKGMVKEVKGLLDSGVPSERLISLGMEYKFTTEHAIGKISFDEMVSLLQTAIHQLAKRQMTWFRGMERRGLQLHWLERGDRDEAYALIDKFLDSQET